MNQLQRATGKGLFYLFAGQILVLSTIVFTFIPVLGLFAMLASFVFSLLGVVSLSKQDVGYRNALYLILVNMILNVIGNLLGKGGLDHLLLAASSAVSFFVTYYICNTTVQMLNHLDPVLAARGEMVWKIYAACAIVSIICELMQYIPVLNILFGVVSFLGGIVSVVGSILYLIFLWKSQKLLQAQ